mmetsp:Transcript_8790/g.22116  ORF Transcript_8790/g.22116 Transcript_8790/m.22116 type:complete len:331 (+) Transcript_8790:3353-4345(+)
MDDFSDSLMWSAYVSRKNGLEHNAATVLIPAMTSVAKDPASANSSLDCRECFLTKQFKTTITIATIGNAASITNANGVLSKNATTRHPNALMNNWYVSATFRPIAALICTIDVPILVGNPSRSFASNHAASWFIADWTNDFWIRNACRSPVYVQIATYADPQTNTTKPTIMNAIASSNNFFSRVSMRPSPPIVLMRRPKLLNVSNESASNANHAGIPHPATVANKIPTNIQTRSVGVLTDNNLINETFVAVFESGSELRRNNAKNSSVPRALANTIFSLRASSMKSVSGGACCSKVALSPPPGPPPPGPVIATFLAAASTAAVPPTPPVI